jgi:antitoxin component of MazEF toxin-antitoxin module
MVKRLKKVGNGNALFLDKAILELVGLQEGGQVQLTVRDGSIIVTPVFPKVASAERFEAALERVATERRKVLRRLAE